MRQVTRPVFTAQNNSLSAVKSILFLPIQSVHSATVKKSIILVGVISRKLACQYFLQLQLKGHISVYSNFQF